MTSKTHRSLHLTCILLLLSLSQKAMAQSDLVSRLYLDFTGSRPSSAQVGYFVSRVESAATDAERRAYVRELLVGQLMNHANFELRLSSYFSGLFGLSPVQGLVAPPCAEGVPAPCVSEALAKDFRDEPPRFIARVIAGRAESTDVRSLLTSRATVMTPEMARFVLRHEDVRRRIGLENTDLAALDEAGKKAPGSWHPINRDPDLTGVSTGSADHREVPAGILTSPAFLMRSPTHLARAYNTYQWFMCRTLQQSPVAEGRQPKLADRPPCSGCHSFLEPAGSFFVHWRAKPDPLLPEQAFVLDGVRRLDAQGKPLPSDGKVPADIDDSSSLHSRSTSGVLRGHAGKGVAAFAGIVTADPDFARCMATHAWQFVLGRKIDASEEGWADVLGKRLANDYNWDLREIMVDVVLSRAYADGAK